MSDRVLVTRSPGIGYWGAGETGDLVFDHGH